MIITAQYNKTDRPSYIIHAGENLDLEEYLEYSAMVKLKIRKTRPSKEYYSQPNGGNYCTITVEENECSQEFKITNRDFRVVISTLLSIRVGDMHCINKIYDAENGFELTDINVIKYYNNYIHFSAQYKYDNGKSGYGEFLTLISEIYESHPEQFSTASIPYYPMNSYGLFPTLAEKIDVVPLSMKTVEGKLGKRYESISLFYGCVGSCKGVFCRNNGEYVLMCGKNEDTGGYEYRNIDYCRKQNQGVCVKFDKDGNCLDDFSCKYLIVPAESVKLDVKELKLPKKIMSYAEAESITKFLFDVFDKAMDICRDLKLENEERIPLTYMPTRRLHNLNLNTLSAQFKINYDVKPHYRFYPVFSPKNSLM